MLKRYFIAGGAGTPGTVSFNVYGKIQNVAAPFADSEPCYMYYSTNGTTWTAVPGNVSFISKTTYKLLGAITVNVGTTVYLRTVDGNNDPIYKIESCWDNGCTGGFIYGDKVISVGASQPDIYATVRFSSTGHWYPY